MKVIIIEGTDNIGKDSLISKILEEFPTTTLIHCSVPYARNNKIAAKEQDVLFQSYVDAINRGDYNKTHCVILNRSWTGEYVYGVMYRNRDENDILIKINNWERELINNSNDVYYIQLLSSSSKLLQQNEDNKSLSNGDENKIIEETQRFENIFKLSIIPHKKLIYVNENDKFKSKESIQRSVLKFIN